MIVGLLQARVSSTRLPSKVLEPILGRPMLSRQIERVLRCETLDALVIATSTDPGDDAIEALAADLGVECFRGSLDDVLDRMFRAAAVHRPSHVVRVTGDCPLIDPAVSDAVVRFGVDGAYDFASNCLRATFPDGLDTEVCTFTALETAWREAPLRSDREHVMPYLYNHPERFSLGSYESPIDRSDLRWTVDTARDLDFARAIYDELYPATPDFLTDDILALLACRPELADLNADQVRNDGYLRSLDKDATSQPEEQPDV